MEWEEYDYFGSRRSTYTLLQLSVLAFILMVQPYEVEAVDDCVDDWREGKKEHYSSLKHPGTELLVHGSMLFITLWQMGCSQRNVKESRMQ